MRLRFFTLIFFISNTRRTSQVSKLIFHRSQGSKASPPSVICPRTRRSIYLSLTCCFSVFLFWHTRNYSRNWIDAEARKFLKATRAYTILTQLSVFFTALVFNTSATNYNKVILGINKKNK